MEELNFTEEEKAYWDKVNQQNRESYLRDNPEEDPALPEITSESLTDEESAEIDAEIELEEEEEFEARRDLNWVDNAMLGLRDSIDDNFQGNSQTREEIEERFIEKRGEREKQIQSNPIRQVLAETTGAVEGASAQTIETLGETVELGIDTLRAGIKTVLPGQEDPKNIPWNENYEWADWDLGTANAKTPVGKFAEQMIAVVIGMKGLKAAGVGVGGGKTLQSRVASETFRGALYDFFSEPGEGNMSNLVQSGPFANNLSKALAHDEFDNPWIRRLKNMIEGGIIGTAVDGVQEAYGAFRAGRKAKLDALAKGESLAKAAEKAVEATRKYTYGEQPELDLGKPVKGKKKKISSKSASGNVYETTSQPIYYKPPEPKQGELDLDIRVNKQGELDFGPDRPDLDPGNAARKAENVQNSGRPSTVSTDDQVRQIWESDPNRKTPYDELTDLQKSDLTKAYRASNMLVEGKPALFDPQDRVQQTRKFNINESVSSFWEGPLGSGKSLVNEADISRLKDIDQLKSFIKEQIPDIDVDYLTARLRRQPEEHVLKTMQSLAQFADTRNPALLEPLRFKSTLDIKGVDAGGAVVLDTLVNSVSERISFLAEEAYQLTQFDVPFKLQARQILDRGEALLTMKKEATRFSSDNLKNWGDVPPDTLRALEADNAIISKVFRDMREGLEATDPLAIKRFQKQFGKLSIALAHSKGDPTAITNVIYGIGKVGFKRVESVYINSLLSSPLTHTRNIAGNTIAMGERTASRTVGNLLTGDFKGARLGAASFDSIYTTFVESLAVAKSSFNSPYAITTPKSNLTNFVLEDRKAIVNMRRSAGPAGRIAGDLALTAFDLFNNIWFNWPGKALQAGDDFTKSMLARMELRYEAAVEADRLAGEGASFKSREELYQTLSTRKLSASGEILDHKLVKITEDAAFQRDLEGWAGSMSAGVQKLPGGRLVLPFFRTGHNISRYALQLSPLAKLSSEHRHVMKYGTPDEQAIMRGRMALGSTITGMAAMLTTQGLMTGYGPEPGPRREQWLQDHEPISVWVGPFDELMKSKEDRNYKKGKWVSFAPLPGFAILLSTTSDLVTNAGKLAQGDYEYLAGALPFFAANAILEQPMFQGVLNMAEIFDLRNETPEGLTAKVYEMGNTVLGNSSARRHLQSLLSSNMHEYQTWYQTALNKMTGGLAAPAMEALGLESGKVLKPDILTGLDIPNKYNNPVNSLNPFTVIGKHASPLLDEFARLEYPINLAHPKRIGGVTMDPSEERLYRLAMYDNGNFAKQLTDKLRSTDFQRAYNSWRDRVEGRDVLPAEPRKESSWYGMLDKLVAAANERGRNALVKGDNPVSINWKNTYAERSAKLGSGKEDPASFDVINNIKDYAAFTQPTK